MKSRSLAALALAVLAATSVRADDLEPLTIGTKSLKGASLRLYGFLEADSIYDTTQSFTEEPDNNLVQTRTTSAGAQNITGQRSREIMSVRNSRLGLELNVPATDSGLKTKAVFEADFLGNNATNATPGTTPGAQSERDFFNNAALRVRHAYVDLTKGELNAKIGQYWSLLGWQPYYFPGEAIVQPAVGQLYRRFVQARLTDTHSVGTWTIEAAADAAKPAGMNSGSPEWHGGLRVASTDIKGASIGGAGTSMVGLSAAVSGALLPVRSATIGSPTGGAIAVDIFVPIIPSADGKSRSNTLIWAAEAAAGSGIGGLEYAGLTFGVPGISAATAGADGAIDSGMAGLNRSAGLELIRLRAFRTHLQYSLPGGRWATSVGYAQAEARNLDRFGAGATALTLAPKLQYAYASVMYDPTAWLRFAAEINKTRDTYNDANNRRAENNRFQTTAYFLF